MSSLQLARYIVFGITALFSLVVIGISAWFINLFTATLEIPSLTFNNVGVAAGVLTLVGIIVAVVLEKTVAPTPSVLSITIESITIVLLSCLWIASAVLAGQKEPNQAECNHLEGILENICKAFPAIIAFSVLALFGVLAWGVLLGLMANRRSEKGVVRA